MLPSRSAGLSATGVEMMVKLQGDRNIWIVEDDPGSRFVYEEILGIRYRLRLFDTLTSFREACETDSGELPDLLIADLKLPDVSFLSYLSSHESSVLSKFPFLIVSSVDDVDALRLCFQRGALDYITKPFGKAEIVVKLENLFKEVQGQGSQLQIHSDSLTVFRHGERSQSLTSKEFQIITILQSSPDRPVSRKELIERIWGNIRVGTKTLDVHIFNLRKKLAPLGIEIEHIAPHAYRLNFRNVL